MRSPGARIGLVILALFAASEIALRLLTDYDSRWNVRLGADRAFDERIWFRNKPHLELGNGLTTNELGYRAPPNLTAEPPDAQLRVLYVGDSASVTPRVDPYPVQVEPLVEAALGTEVQTVNTAVPGHSSENGRVYYETEVSQLRADHCFVYLGWNDLGQFGPEGLPYKRREAGYEISRLQRALSQIYSGRFLYALQETRRQRLPAANEPMTPAERALYDSYSPDHYVENLHAIVSLAKTRCGEVTMTNLATITSEDPDARELATAHFPVGMSKNMTKLHHLVRQYSAAAEQVAREQGVPLIDLSSLYDSREARRGFTDSAHMNSEGAARMARVVADHLIAAERASPSLPRKSR